MHPAEKISDKVYLRTFNEKLPFISHRAYEDADPGLEIVNIYIESKNSTVYDLKHISICHCHPKDRSGIRNLEDLLFEVRRCKTYLKKHLSDMDIEEGKNHFPIHVLSKEIARDAVLISQIERKLAK